MRTSLSGKFRSRQTPLATLLLLVAVVFSVRSLAGQQCLEVEVLDPSSAPVSNANGLHWQQGTVDRRLRLRDFLRTRRGFSLDYRLSSGFPDQGSTRAASRGPDHFRTSTRHLERGSGCCGDSHGGAATPWNLRSPSKRIRGDRLRRSRRAGDRPGAADGVTLVQFLQFQHQRRHGRLTPGHPCEAWARTRRWYWSTGNGATTAHCCTSIPPLAEETAGTDMNAIPLAAIERIEVLRDGAAAQYGSDAIAGVINIVLRNRPGFSMDTSWGQTYAGDGDIFTNSMHGGFASENGAFLNLTFETRLRDSTNRAGLSGARQYPYTDCASGQTHSTPAGGNCFDPREYTFNRKNFRIGDAESEQYSTYYNAGIPLGDNAGSTPSAASRCVTTTAPGSTGGPTRTAESYCRSIQTAFFPRSTRMSTTSPWRRGSSGRRIGIGTSTSA